MVEKRRYSQLEINYVLSRVLAGWRSTTIAKAFKSDHAPYWDSKLFTKHQVSYIKNTYKGPPGSVKPYTGPVPRFPTSPSPDPLDNPATPSALFTDEDYGDLNMTLYHPENENAPSGSFNVMSTGEPLQQIQNSDLAIASIEGDQPQKDTPVSNASAAEAGIDVDKLTHGRNGELGHGDAENKHPQSHWDIAVSNQEGVMDASPAVDTERAAVFPDPMIYGAQNWLRSDANGSWYGGPHDGCSHVFVHHHSTAGHELRFLRDGEFVKVMRDQAIARQQSGTQFIIQSQDLNEYKFNRYGFDVHGYSVDERDAKGFNARGYDQHGFDAYGYDARGYDILGYDSNHLDKNGVRRAHNSQLGYGVSIPMNWDRQVHYSRSFDQQNAQGQDTQQQTFFDNSLIDPNLPDQQPVHTVRAPVQLNLSMLNTPVNSGGQSGSGSAFLGSSHHQQGQQQQNGDLAGLIDPALHQVPDPNNQHVGHAASTAQGVLGGPFQFPNAPLTLSRSAWDIGGPASVGGAAAANGARATADKSGAGPHHGPANNPKRAAESSAAGVKKKHKSVSSSSSSSNSNSNSSASSMEGVRVVGSSKRYEKDDGDEDFNPFEQSD